MTTLRIDSQMKVSIIIIKKVGLFIILYMQLKLNVIGLGVQWIGSPMDIPGSRHNWQNQLIEDSSFSINANIYFTHPSSIKHKLSHARWYISLEHISVRVKIVITFSDIHNCF